jgi:YrbI family 3-deoxy-D-manno-octulosonate 8-phosphate phosphatase
MNQKLLKKFKDIKIVLTDVDGVLTDGGMYYSSKGDTMKKFHVRDGMAVNMLKKHNIPTIIVTKEKNRIITQWAKKMNVKKIFDGVLDKEKILKKVCKEFDVKTSNIVYIGDDVNDMVLLKNVGISVSPADAWKNTKQIVDYVSEKHGGKGVLREISDLILASNNKL